MSGFIIHYRILFLIFLGLIQVQVNMYTAMCFKLPRDVNTRMFIVSHFCDYICTIVSDK